MKNGQERYRELLKSRVIERYSRTLDSPTDYDALSLDISDKTGEQVSSSTLKRLYGYNHQATTPRPSTLSTLARYVGYAGWSDFVANIPSDNTAPCTPSNPNRAIIWATILIITIVSLSMFVLLRQESDTEPAATTKIDKVDPLPKTHTSVEQINREWMELTISRCDSIRALRSRNTIIEYKEIVDSFYFPFLFSEVFGGIERDFKDLYMSDSTESIRLESELKSACQQVCLELMREIAQEYTEATQKIEEQSQK